MARKDFAFEVWNLVDDRGEELPAHVGGRLEFLVGAGTGRAQEVAAVRGLEIDANRLSRGVLVAPLVDALEIAPRIDLELRRGLHRHGAPPPCVGDAAQIPVRE